MPAESAAVCSAVWSEVTPELPTEIGELSPAARQGLAQVFQVNVADAQAQLIELFDDDDDPEVRRHAASAMRHLDDLEVADVEALVRCFMNSQSFGEHFESLLDALDDMTATLPDVAIEVSTATSSAPAIEARIGLDIGSNTTLTAFKATPTTWPTSSPTALSATSSTNCGASTPSACATSKSSTNSPNPTTPPPPPQPASSSSHPPSHG